MPVNRPHRLLAIAAALIAGPGVLWWAVASRTPAPSPEVPAPSAKAPSPSSPAPATAAQVETSARVQELEQRLAAEHRARQDAESAAADLRARLAPLDNQVVVSYGRIEDIGKHTAALLSANAELEALSSRDPATLSADEKHRLLDLQRQQADVLGMLPEIAGFQNNPAEYGRFFRSMLQQSAQLTDPQAAQVESYMTQRAQAMDQLGLNAARQPTDPTLADPWETQRDQFNQQTASGLTSILPPGAANRAGFNAGLMEFLEMDFPQLKSGSSPDN